MSTTPKNRRNRAGFLTLFLRFDAPERAREDFEYEAFDVEDLTADFFAPEARAAVERGFAVPFPEREPFCFAERFSTKILSCGACRHRF